MLNQAKPTKKFLNLINNSSHISLAQRHVIILYSYVIIELRKK